MNIEAKNDLMKLRVEFKEIAFKAYIARAKDDLESAAVYKKRALELLEQIKKLESKTKVDDPGFPNR